MLLSLCMSLLLGACQSNEPDVPVEPQEQDYNGVIVYRTDSTDWLVYIFRSGVLASEDISVPEPFHIPTHEEAKVLKTITYGASGQRYFTDDGYTFGMPSASITKAGSKTKYSILGLQIRRTVIVVTF